MDSRAFIESGIAVDELWTHPAKASRRRVGIGTAAGQIGRRRVPESMDRECSETGIVLDTPLVSFLENPIELFAYDVPA